MSHAFLIVQGTKPQRKKRIKKLVAALTGKSKIKLKHPDIFFIKGKTSISIGQIRRLKNQVQRKPYLLSKKVALLWEADKLTFPAQNSLLKLLEEPPENTLLLLSCQNESLLLPTVVSRCQIIRIIPKEKTNHENLMESASLLKKLVAGHLKTRFDEAEILAKDRQKTITFLNDSLLIFRDLIHTSIGVKKNSPFSNPALKKLSLSQLHAQIKATQKIREDIKKNVNARLALENLFLNLPGLH